MHLLAVAADLLWVGALPNVDQINLKLKEIGIPELSTSGVFTTGGAGFIYIGVIKNLRVGGMGYGGTIFFVIDD